MLDEIRPDKQAGYRYHDRVTAFVALLLLWPLAPALAEEPRRFHANITWEHGYRFQGIDQGRGQASLHASGRYRFAGNWSTGVWVGEYQLPYDSGDTREVDYFIGYSNQLSFDRRIETSIWRYTFNDDYFDDYDWTQWLTSYHSDERFTLTAGVAHNFLNSEEMSTFFEGTMRRSFGPWTLSLSAGRNVLSQTRLDSFEYVQLQTVFTYGGWHVFGRYTRPVNVDNPLTSTFAREGAGFGISYAF